jgi:hypothetical protein
MFNAYFSSGMHYWKVISIFLIVDLWLIAAVGLQGRFKTGNDVINRYSNHGFLFVFCGH